MDVFLDATAPHRTSALSADALESRTMPTGGHPHVLYLNRLPKFLEPLLDILDGEGFTVTTHVHLDRQLDAIVDLAPDIIIMDYMGIQSDDEWVVLNQLRLDQRTRPIPLIPCTGSVMDATEMQEYLSSIGIMAVEESYTIDHLIQAVHAAVDERAGRDDLQRGD